MKPKHFRELEPNKNCLQCRHKKCVFPIAELPKMKCMKHDFDLPGTTNKVLESFVCDDFQRYEDES